MCNSVHHPRSACNTCARTRCTDQTICALRAPRQNKGVPPPKPSRLDSKVTRGGGKLQNTPTHIYRLNNQRSLILKSADMRN